MSAGFRRRRIRPSGYQAQGGRKSFCLAVLVGVFFRSVFVVFGVQMMAMRDLGMMRRLFMSETEYPLLTVAVSSLRIQLMGLELDRLRAPVEEWIVAINTKRPLHQEIVRLLKSDETEIRLTVTAAIA